MFQGTCVSSAEAGQCSTGWWTAIQWWSDPWVSLLLQSLIKSKCFYNFFVFCVTVFSAFIFFSNIDPWFSPYGWIFTFKECIMVDSQYKKRRCSKGSCHFTDLTIKLNKIIQYFCYLMPNKSSMQWKVLVGWISSNWVSTVRLKQCQICQASHVC